MFVMETRELAELAGREKGRQGEDAEGEVEQGKGNKAVRAMWKEVMAGSLVKLEAS